MCIRDSFAINFIHQQHMKMRCDVHLVTVKGVLKLFPIIRWIPACGAFKGNTFICNRFQNVGKDSLEELITEANFISRNQGIFTDTQTVCKSVELTRILFGNGMFCNFSLGNFESVPLWPLRYVSVFISTSAPQKTGRTDGENKQKY